MQYLEEMRWMPYLPHQIYDFLSEPKSLALVVGRIADAKVVYRNGDEGKLKVILDLPLQKFTESEGEAEGKPYERLTFRMKEPFPLEFTWQFQTLAQEGQDGTQVLSRLGVDFSGYGFPALGAIVTGLIGNEIREDLDRLASELTKRYG